MNTILTLILVAAVTLFSSTVFRNIGLAMIFNTDALMIVGGGTIVAVFIAFPFKRLKKTFFDIVAAFRSRQDRDEMARDILEIARIHRRADIRGLERKLRTKKDEFLRVGINLLLTNRTNEEIRSAMEREMSVRVMDYNFSQNVLKTIARLTPSFGLAGTVISLIKMFKNMQSVDTMAPLMAVAMMSTFYGVIISNLFMLPLCAKLETHALESEALMHSTIEGFESINNREHPLKSEEKIKAYCDSGKPDPAGIGEELTVARNDRSV